MNTLNTDTITRRVLLLALAIAPAIALAHGGLEHVRGTVAKVSGNVVTIRLTRRRLGFGRPEFFTVKIGRAANDDPLEIDPIRVGWVFLRQVAKP